MMAETVCALFSRAGVPRVGPRVVWTVDEQRNVATRRLPSYHVT